MKAIETHSGLSTILVDKSEYDALWISSLTHSAIKGHPDNELVTLQDRVEFVRETRRLTNKPIVVDIDTGGLIEHLPQIMKWFEEAGAYAVIMEDKKWPKQNSLLEDGKHQLEDIDAFSEKIMVAKKNVKDLKIIARLESLIAKKSKYEAILRAEAYIAAGADGVMVHSKTKVDATEVMEVGEAIRKEHPDTILVAVPTTYTLPEIHPFDIVIEANHLLRASLKAMQKYINGEEVELSSVQDLFDLVGH